MNAYWRHQKGFSLVELMVATVIGLVIAYSVLELYLAQSQIYKTASSQDVIQSTENAITNLITPIIRSSGFTGCGTIASAVSNLNSGGPAPLGTLNTIPALLIGYSGGTANYTIASDNPANDGNTNDWVPSLEPTLAGMVGQYSDVVIVFGSAPGASPIGITSITSGSSFFSIQNASGTTLTAGQFAGVSDCAKTIIFQISSVAGTIVSHNSGTGILANASSAFPVDFQNGAQFVPLQQTAFFIAQGQGGQSALMRATLIGTSWAVEPLVPGIEVMKVQYGIGTGGVITQYVPANAVTNWAQVYAIRLGFLIEGQPGSGSMATSAYTVLDTQVTVPADNKIRHVFEMTINLRNATS